MVIRRGRPEDAVPGIGLGLALCRAVLQAHGGTITGRQRGTIMAFSIIPETVRQGPGVGPPARAGCPTGQSTSATP